MIARWSFLIVVLLAEAVGSRAEERRAAEMLEGLRQRGYGDTAVEYLEMLKKQGQLPPELQETYDLQMSECLRSAARDAYNAKEAEQLTNAARASLENFIRQKPDDYRTGAAITKLGLLSTDKAAKLLEKANQTTNAPEHAKLLEQTRQALADARDKFQQAIAKFESPVASKPPAADPNQKRRGRGPTLAEMWENDRLNAHLQAALVQYYFTKTDDDPKSENHIAALKKAAEAFDAVFQANRMNSVGLYAHMWHGKVLEELGDPQTAVDVYDEVLANSPDRNQPGVDPELRTLFAQVELSRLEILAKQDSPEQFISEATEWLRTNYDSRRTDGYQGIAFQLAKTLLEQGDKAFSGDRARLTARALGLLSDVIASRSPYQQEAIQLRAKYSKTLGQTQPKTFDEARGMADLAAKAGVWKEAVSGYLQALVLAEKTGVKDVAAILKVREALANARLMLARQLFNEGKMDEAIRAAGEVVSQAPQSASAAPASALAVIAALNLFIEASDEKKPEAWQRLKKLADFTVSKWPAKSEADDARMALGQASLASGKIADALAVFENVNPKSDRYPAAVHLAGATYWQRYVSEKSRPEAARDARQMASDRDKARELLTRSLDLQRQANPAGNGPTRQLVDTQLLLAEIALESGDRQKGEEMLRPLVESLQKSGMAATDPAAVSLAVAAIRMKLSTGDLAAAADLGQLLVDSGVDTVPANAALLRLVQALRKSQPPKATNASTGAEAPPAVKAADSGASDERLKKILPKLATHEHLSAAAMAYVAEGLESIGQPADAQALNRRLVARADQDPAAARELGGAVAYARSQLVGDLVKQGKYKEAFDQISQVVAVHPRALQPLMEQGRIVQSWAGHDTSRYAAATQHWSKLRGMLLNVRPKPPEFYEVNYRLAECLYHEARLAPTAETGMAKAKQAEQLLKADLVLNPKLTGPEMVANYQALLKQVTALEEKFPATARSSSR